MVHAQTSTGPQEIGYDDPQSHRIHCNGLFFGRGLLGLLGSDFFVEAHHYRAPGLGVSARPEEQRLVLVAVQFRLDDRTDDLVRRVGRRFVGFPDGPVERQARLVVACGE